MNDNLTTNNEAEKPAFLVGAVRYGVDSHAVTGTFHGSIVESKSEGEARRIFHKRYNGESITHVVLIQINTLPQLCFCNVL